MNKFTFNIIYLEFLHTFNKMRCYYLHLLKNSKSFKNFNTNNCDLNKNKSSCIVCCLFLGANM